MNFINTYSGKLSIAALLSVGLITTAFAEQFPHNSGDQAKRMENAIRDNVDGVLKLDANKTYLFSRTLNIRKKIKIIGDGGTILKLDRTSNAGSFVRCEANEIAFENLTLDASNKVNKAIVDINDMIGVSFESVHLKNAIHPNSKSQGDGIAAYNGRACHGLKVNNCIFTNISHMGVKIINRDTDKYRRDGPNRNLFTNGEIRKLLAPVIITNSTFNEGIDKIIEADCGNDDFVIDDESDPRWVIEDRDGGRRYTYTTDLAGSIIKKNIFKTHKAWALGLIQASNIKLLGNKIAGPGNTTQSNNAIVHMEQVVHNVTIAWNTMNLNSGVGNPMFISSTSREGRQRLRENPQIIAVRGRGGFTGNTGGNSVRGSDTCPRGANPLTCKKEVHSYGPRNIYIFGNKFRSTANIRHVINFKDGENIKIGLTKNNTVRKNSYSGIDESLVSHSKIKIGKGELGNCDIIINEAELSKQDPRDFDIAVDAAMDDNNNCIQVIESNTSSKDFTTSTLSKSKTFSISPNPATSHMNIIPDTKNNYTIHIYNLAGNIIKQHNGNGTTNINLDRLTSGIYIVEYKDATTVKNKRLIVK